MGGTTIILCANDEPNMDHHSHSALRSPSRWVIYPCVFPSRRVIYPCVFPSRQVIYPYVFPSRRLCHRVG
jgi:hypothetical protein